jgi:hypothetical protein
MSMAGVESGQCPGGELLRTHVQVDDTLNEAKEERKKERKRKTRTVTEAKRTRTALTNKPCILLGSQGVAGNSLNPHTPLLSSCDTSVERCQLSTASFSASSASLIDFFSSSILA